MSVGTTALIAAGIGAAGSIGGALIGSNASSNAAKQQETAEQKVLDLEGSTVPAANKLLSDQNTNDQTALAPYTTAGTGALAQLSKITGAGGFQAPTAAQAAATPGYQFQLGEGEKAQAQAAAASGGALGGGELKAADQYAQGLASTNYGNTYNQSLSTYNTNLGALQQLANMGLGATDTGVSAGNTLAAGQSSNLLTGLGISAGALTGQGNAAAAGTVGSANAWTNGLSGVTSAATGAANNASQMSLLNNILNVRSSGGGSDAGAI